MPTPMQTKIALEHGATVREELEQRCNELLSTCIKRENRAVTLDMGRQVEELRLELDQVREVPLGEEGEHRF